MRCSGDSGEQTTTADGHHDRVDLRLILEHLLCNGACTCSDLKLVVRVTEQGAANLGELDGRLVRLCVLRPNLPHVGA